MPPRTLTRALREELAHGPPAEGAARVWETAGLVRFAGSLRLRGTARGTQIDVEVRCTHAAVARRLRTSLVELTGERPGLAQQRPGNLRGSGGYLVAIPAPVLQQLAVLDETGRPAALAAPEDEDAGRALVRGALMAAGSLSGPGQAVHLEIPGPSESTCILVARSMPGASVTAARVVVKSGPAVQELLAQLGAADTLAVFMRTRRDRKLRRDANRAANFDRANVTRATSAAGRQIAAIEQLVELHGWDAMADDLRDVALARVANPALSLADLGALLDPPVTKATVHRRLARLTAMADVPVRPQDADPDVR